MRHPIEIKEEILRMQAALDELKNVFASRREKRREKLLRELNEI